MIINNKCGDCCFCNSLNAIAAGSLQPEIAYYLFQAQAVIQELCQKQDKIPYFAQYRANNKPSP